MNNREDLNTVIWNLKSVLKEKERFLIRLETDLDYQAGIEWYMKSLKASPWLILKALEVFNLSKQSLSKQNISTIGLHLKQIYILRIKNQIFSLKKAIAKIEEEITKEVYLKHK